MGRIRHRGRHSLTLRVQERPERARKGGED